MPATPRSTVRQRVIAFVVAGLGGTAAAAVSFAMTLYEAANPEQAPVVAAGQPVDTGRWIVTVHTARMSDTPPTGARPLEPKPLLMVELDLNNRSAAPSNAFSGLLEINPPVAGLPDPVFYLARDKWIAGALNPDMPERMIAVWEWPRDEAPPQRLRLEIGSQIHKRRDNLYGAPGWFDRGQAALVALPVAHAGETTP